MVHKITHATIFSTDLKKINLSVYSLFLSDPDTMMAQMVEELPQGIKDWVVLYSQSQRIEMKLHRWL